MPGSVDYITITGLNASLREFFEVDARFIVVATLGDLARDGVIENSVVKKAIKDLGIDPEKSNPAVS